MDRIIYTASTGASRILEQQSTISNNLANINTTGFREQLTAYRAVPYEAPGPALPTRAGTVAVSTGSHLGQGAMVQTGNPLDLAIQGEGWFTVMTPQGEAYTRAAELSVAENGLLVNSLGYPVVLENGMPAEIPDRAMVTFSAQGQISALGAGDNPDALQLVGRLKLVNPPAQTLSRSDDGLFRMAPGEMAANDPLVTMVSGFVEKSNVNAAKALVGMISNARQYELQMKVIQDASANASTANSILSLQ